MRASHHPLFGEGAPVGLGKKVFGAEATFFEGLPQQRAFLIITSNRQEEGMRPQAANI
jgi:hypothetical protein